MKIKKVKPAAVLPRYAKKGDAGLDLYACIDAPTTLKPGERKLIPTGIAIQLPMNQEAQIRPRSGLAFKHGVTVVNSPGTIDSGYRGEISVALINLSEEPYDIQPQDRIAQMVISPFICAELEEVETLDETERGAGGFGSTG